LLVVGRERSTETVRCHVDPDTMGKINNVTTIAAGHRQLQRRTFRPSLVPYALSTCQRAKVLGATSPRLWNLMRDTLGAGEVPSLLRQFREHARAVPHHKNMITQTSPIRAVTDTVEIIRLPGMVSTRTYPAPGSVLRRTTRVG
jgi:hypothetical protein